MNNKGADQPAHLCSLISAFVVHCLDSMIALVSINEISSLYLASMAVQAGLCLTQSQTPKTDFLVMWLQCCWQKNIPDTWSSLHSWQKDRLMMRCLRPSPPPKPARRPLRRPELPRNGRRKTLMSPKSKYGRFMKSHCLHLKERKNAHLLPEGSHPIAL